MTMMIQQTEGIETTHDKLAQIAWLMVTVNDPPYTRKRIASNTGISQHTVRNMQRVKAVLLKQSPGRDLSTVSWQSVKHLASEGRRRGSKGPARAG